MGSVHGLGRIVSKWGMFPVYEHGFWEVPICHGDHLRLFAKSSPNDVRGLFLGYARFAGVSDEDISDIIAEVERT